MASCGICLLPYDSQFRLPKILSCFHTFCRLCLEEMAGRRKGDSLLLCPTCRSETPLEESVAKSLKNNFALMDFIPTSPLFAEGAVCSLCEGDSCEVVCYCPECEQYFCAPMEVLHGKMKGTSSHPLFDYRTPSSPSSSSVVPSPSPSPSSSSSSSSSSPPPSSLVVHPSYGSLEFCQAKSSDSQFLARYSVDIPLPDMPANATSRKAIILLLDRSGSMKRDWSSVCQSVQSVVAHKLDEDTHLEVIVYADHAYFLKFDRSRANEELPVLLEKYKPTNQITVFRSAFQMTEKVITRVKSDLGNDTSFTILLFTDGCDTSIWKGSSVDLPASEKSARQHFDAFRSFIDSSNTQSFIYVAAFTDAHSPAQCTYFGNRYRYIDRPETLDKDLQEVIGEMISGAGQCSLSVDPPYKKLFLLEEIPPLLPLRSNESFKHHFWITAESKEAALALGSSDSINTNLDLVGMESIQFSTAPVFSPVPEGYPSFLFLVQKAAYQLRATSREVPSQPTKSFIDELREKLAFQRNELLSCRKVACAPLHGVGSIKEAVDWVRASQESSLTVEEKGHLRHEIGACDILFDRLSHVVRVFDEGNFTPVQIQAILKDSCQHLPSKFTLESPSSSVSSAPSPRTQKITLTPFNGEFATDWVSGLGLEEVISSGDCLMFDIEGASRLLDRVVGSFGEGSRVCGYETFSFLLETAKKLRKPLVVGDRPLSGLWLPCFFTPRHFETALPRWRKELGKQLQLEDHRVTPNVLFQIFSQSALSCASSSKPSLLGFLHQLRAFREVVMRYGDFGVRHAKAFESSRLRLIEFCSSPLSSQFASPLNSSAIWERFSDALLHPLSPSQFASFVRNVMVGVIVESLSLSSACRPHVLNPKALEKVLRELQCDQSQKLSGPSIQEGLLLLRLLNRVQFLYHQANKSKGDSLFKLIDESVKSTSAFEFLSGLNEASSTVPFFLSCPFVKGREVARLECEDIVAVGFLLALASNSTQDFLEEVRKAAATAILRAWRARGRLGSSSSIPSEPLSWIDPFRSPQAVISSCSRLLSEKKAKLEAIELEKHKEALRKRRQLILSHPITTRKKTFCVCGALFTESHAKEVWGGEATPDDPLLYAECENEVLAGRDFLCVRNFHSHKEALTNKLYCSRGGRFSFVPGETMVKGLHQRVEDLWDYEREKFGFPRGKKKIRKYLQGDDEGAIRELLLRVKYDDRVPKAKERLTEILRWLWEANKKGGKLKSTLLSSLDPSHYEDEGENEKSKE